MLCSLCFLPPPSSINLLATASESLPSLLKTSKNALSQSFQPRPPLPVRLQLPLLPPNPSQRLSTISSPLQRRNASKQDSAWASLAKCLTNGYCYLSILLHPYITTKKEVSSECLCTISSFPISKYRYKYQFLRFEIQCVKLKEVAGSAACRR